MDIGGIIGVIVILAFVCIVGYLVLDLVVYAAGASRCGRFELAYVNYKLRSYCMLDGRMIPSNEYTESMIITAKWNKMDKYLEVAEEVIKLVDELTNYFDSYYLGMEHTITDECLFKIKKILLEE